MFTILMKYQKTNREVILEADTVEFIPGKCMSDGLLLNHGVDGEGCHLLPTPKDDKNWRDVFIMNEQGQTVARYTL